MLNHYAFKFSYRHVTSKNLLDCFQDSLNYLYKLNYKLHLNYHLASLSWIYKMAMHGSQGAGWKKSISLDYYDSIKEISICWKVIKFTNLQLIDLFRGHAFLPLLENPGFQFLKKQQMDGGIKVFQALWGVYPILMLTVVFIVLAGIFVWIFVSAT